MKRNIGTLILIISIFTFIPQHGLFCEPDSAQVKEEHAKILSELGYNKEAPTTNPLVDLIKAVFDFFRKSPLLSIVVLAAFIFLCASLLTRFLNVFKKDPLAKENVKDVKDGQTGSNIGQQYQELCKHAISLAEQGEYNKAVVNLHKASILYLKIKKIIFFGEYQTNNEIKRELKEKNGFYEPFSTLALKAERITFRAESISKEQYLELYSVYKRSFKL
jgi:HEPN domain-containing protein